MKIKTLYVKILVSFLGVLAVTLILIMALFFATGGRSFKNYIVQQSFAKLTLLKADLEERIKSNEKLPIAKNTEVKTFLERVSRLFDVTIWMTGPDGQMLFNTHQPPSNAFLGQRGRNPIVRDGIRLYHFPGRHLSSYAQLRLNDRGAEYLVHLYSKKGREEKSEAFFLIGLLSIGGIIAVLIIPLTRLVVRRVKKLTQAARAFAEGNLQHRADIGGHDEIAKLGDTFDFMADKIEKMIQGNKELMANLSHELRSPLARIKVSKELIAERIQSKEGTGVENYINHIDQDIDTLDKLIDQILKLSRIDYQETLDAIRNIDFDAFILEMEEKYTPLINRKRIHISRNIEPGIRISADPSCLQIIFVNLFDNAIKYTRESGRIEICAVRKNSGKTVFTIANPCRRLSDAELDNIFDPFVRIGEHKSSGSGLGLTIVKKMIQKCGAVIRAQNSDAGLMFELEFP